MAQSESAPTNFLTFDIVVSYRAFDIPTTKFQLLSLKAKIEVLLGLVMAVLDDLSSGKFK